jgi:cell division protease FtsH
MVMRFGMSEKLGPRVFGHDHGQPFLGREFSSEPDYSDDVAREIDGEIRRIVEEAHQLARRILEQHREDLANTSEILLRRETIEREQFLELLDGKAEGDVFGPDEPIVPQPAELPPSQERKPEREGSRPTIPRPGFAGGTADMRADEPRKPDLS